MVRHLEYSDIADRRRERGGSRCGHVSSFGFTLLELTIVIFIIMILASVAATAYQRHIVQAREAVLRENVKQINIKIQEFTMDQGQAPQSLDDLVSKGYFHELPRDPTTNAADWDCDQEDSENAADPQQPGISSCHSRSSGTSVTGEAYSSWH
jgi:general secretion pathway protein G